jgi:hypothetical protein
MLTGTQARTEKARRVALNLAQTLVVEPSRRARHAATASLLRRGRQRTFTVDGREVPYFLHAYNTTWRNERGVEIALALEALRRRPGRLLEVGNVLGHYLPAEHDVVDKYELGPGVQNVDVLAFEPAHDYDLIVAISTLEHVGLDEDDIDPEKPAKTLERLSGFLAPAGELFVTVPLGYNPALDGALLAGELELDEVWYFKRVSARNDWVQAAAADVVGAEYGRPFEKANAIAIGTRRRRA